MKPNELRYGILLTPEKGKFKKSIFKVIYYDEFFVVGKDLKTGQEHSFAMHFLDHYKFIEECNLDPEMVKLLYDSK